MKIFSVLAVLLAFTVPVLAESLNIVELKTPHGVRFSFLRSDIQNTVAIAVAFKGGVGSDDPAGPATGTIAPALMTAGAGGKTASELYELMQDFGASYTLHSTADQTYGFLSAPSKGINGAAKLANLVLTHPDFPDKKLAERRESMAQRLEEYASYPDSKLQSAFNAAVSEPHPYENFNNPSPASVRRITRGDMAQWMANHITKDGILVSVVGDLEPAEAGVLVDQMLDGVPEKTALKASPAMIFKSPPAQAIELRVDTGDQALIVMGSSYAFDSNLKDWLAAGMLSSIFSGDQKSRLFKDIREASGATYGLQPVLSFSDAVFSNGILGRIAKADSDKTLALIKSSWDKFRISGPSEDEIRNAKANMQRYFTDLARNHEAMAGFVRDYMTGHWTSAEIAQLPELVATSDLRDAKLLAKLFPEKPLVVIAK